MKQLLLVLLAFAAIQSSAQEQPFLAMNTQNVITVSNFADNDLPTPSYNSGKCSNGYTVSGNILAVIGGALIGWPLGTAIGGGDPEWVLAAAGAGVLAIAIPLAIIGGRKCNGYSSIQEPDEKYYTGNKQPAMELQFASTGNTIGLRLQF